jgi:hypothetical protein
MTVQRTWKSIQFRPLSTYSQIARENRDERDKLRPNGRVTVQIELDSDGLSDPAPTSATSKNSRSGISWMGWNCPLGVSLFGQCVYIFFWAFFSQIDFFSPHPWSQVFGGGGELLPTPQPTYHPPSSLFLPTTPQPPPFALTSIARACELGRAWIAHNFD